MKKYIALMLAAMFLLPMALASSPAYIKPFPQDPKVSEEDARNIARTWGVEPISSEISWDYGIEIWRVRGSYKSGIGPDNSEVEAIAKIDSFTGELMGIELIRTDIHNKKEILEKLAKDGITVHSSNLYRAESLYWEMYGTRKTTVAGFTFDVQLYITADATTGEIISIRGEPYYRGMEVDSSSGVAQVGTKSVLRSIAEDLPVFSKPRPLVAERMVVVD